MRKLISLLLAVLLVLGTPMTAMAITVDAQYGDVTIGDTQVTHKQNKDDVDYTHSDHGGEVIVKNSDTTEYNVSVNIDGNAEGNSSPIPESVTVKADSGDVNINGGVVASGGAEVTVNGNVSNENGPGVDASDRAEVTVTGDVNGGKTGVGVNANNATVIVGGNVSGADNAHIGNDHGETYAAGGNGIDASSGSYVKVGGDVTGGSANAYYAHGGDGVYADKGSKVEVGGSVTGGSAEGSSAGGGDGVYADKGSKVEVGGSVTGGSAEGSSAGGGDGVYAFEGSEVEVNGSTTGGSADGDTAHGGAGVEAGEGSEVEVNGSTTGGSADGDTAHGGNGITMQGDSVIQVAGDAVGGSTTGGASNSEDGFGANIYVKSATPGSLTVKGEVSGGSDSADIYVEEWPIYLAGDKPGVEHVPDISVGNYDSIEFNDYFTEEEARQIVGSIKLTNRPSSSPSDDVTVKRSSGTARNGYYMGCLWRNGYITRTLFKVENGAGMKPIWEEAIENGTLTITCENEPVILTTWLEGLKQHQKLGIERIVVKTKNCETELVIADLIAMNGTEYVLTQKGDTATLTVDGKEAEIG